MYGDFDARQNGFDGARVYGFTGERAIKIDDVQPIEPLIRKRGRLRRWIVVEDGRLVHVALDEAHTAPVLQVDGGEKITAASAENWRGV